MRWVHTMLLAALGCVGANLDAARAWAQDFPTRPITVVVPFPAGGPSDVLVRIMGEPMRASLGQPIVVENVAGASGSIGVGRVARAEPNGYSLIFGSWVTHVVNGAVYTLKYDVTEDFEPVVLIGANPLLIVGRKSLPANDLRELIDWAKSNPDKGTIGTTGAGTALHVAGVFFQKEIGSRLPFVPYRGGALLVQDLVAGQIDMSIDVAANSLPQVTAGALKAYAVTDKRRLAAAPNIPTVDESGLPGLHVGIWYALWAPKGTPHDALAKLNAAAMGALADAGVRQRLAELGLDVVPPERQTPQALRAYHKAEIDRWWPIIKAAGIKAE